MPDRRARLSMWLMLLAPIAALPAGFVPFVFPKLVVTALAVLVGLFSPALARLPRAIWSITAAGTVVFLLVALTTDAAVSALVGRWPRYEGLPVLSIYLASAMLGAHLVGARGHRRHEGSLTAATATMSIFLAGSTLLDLAGIRLVDSDLDRTGALLGSATDQGLVAMMSAALLVGWATTRSSPLIIAGLASAVLTVALSGSRAAIATTLLVFVVHAALSRGAAARQILLIIGGLVAAVLILPATRERLSEGSGRYLLWQETFHLLRDHPWRGAGPSGFVDAVGRYENIEWARLGDASLLADSPHTWPLQAAASGGVGLLLVALALAAVVVTLGLRSVRGDYDATQVGIFAAVLGYGLALLLNFTAAGSTCMAAFLVGALVAEQARMPAWRPMVHRASVAVAAAMVIGTLSASIAEIDLDRGAQAAARGDLPQASAAFFRATRWRPFDSDVAMIAAQSFAGSANSGDVPAADKAAYWARRSLDRTPDSYDAGLALAIAEITRNDLPKALMRLDRLTGLRPFDPRAYVQRAIVRFGLRQVDGARSDLLRAIRLDPRDSVAPSILDEINRRVPSAG